MQFISGVNLDEHAWFNKELGLERLGRYDEAIQAFDKAIEINPQLSIAWGNKGLALEKISKYDDAIKAYDKTIEINPKHAEYETNHVIEPPE